MVHWSQTCSGPSLSKHLPKLAAEGVIPKMLSLCWTRRSSDRGAHSWRDAWTEWVRVKTTPQISQAEDFGKKKVQRGEERQGKIGLGRHWEARVAVKAASHLERKRWWATRWPARSGGDGWKIYFWGLLVRWTGPRARTTAECTWVLRCLRGGGEMGRSSPLLLQCFGVLHVPGDCLARPPWGWKLRISFQEMLRFVKA